MVGSFENALRMCPLIKWLLSSRLSTVIDLLWWYI